MGCGLRFDGCNDLWVARVKWCGERLGWAGWGRDGMGKGRGGMGFENRLACPRNSSSTARRRWKFQTKPQRGARCCDAWMEGKPSDGPVSLSLSPSLPLSIISICLSVYLTIYLSICLSIYLSTHLSNYLSN